MKRRSLVTLVTDLLCRSYSKHGSTLYTVYYLRTKFLHLPLACEDSGTDTKHVIDAKHEVHGVIKDSLFYFHPAPRFVKGCEINILAYNPHCMYHLSCQVSIDFYIDLCFCLYTYILYLSLCLFLAQKNLYKNMYMKQIAKNR